MFFAPSPSLTGLRCHPLSLWHFANAPSDALKCSLLRFLSACSVNGRHWRRMLAIDTWQALNAFIEAVIAASCLVASVGECRRQGRSHLIRGAGAGSLLGYGWGKAPRFWTVLVIFEKWIQVGVTDTPTCIQYVEFEQEKSRFLLLAFMYAVKNGYHVQLGVSLSRNIKTTLLQSWACKEKAFSASRFAPWTALLDYILTFQITENQ